MGARITNEEVIEHNKQFNKMMRKLRSVTNIKDCFHSNKSECVLPIKSAHSLQKQGSLRFLEKEKGGNRYVYVHTEKQHNFEHKFYDLKPTGRKAATTFDGFCEYHDTELFKKIENEPEITDINNDEHLFLHSYRSFAIAYHRKHEELKMYDSTDPEIVEMLNELYSPHQLFEARLGVEAALNDIKYPKQQIDKFLSSQDFSAMEYLVFEYHHTVPAGCAAFITPYQMPSGRKIQTNTNSKFQSSILTTVLPFSNRTIVILAAFPEDKLSCEFLDELEQIKFEVKQQKFLSFFLFDGAENVVVSPHYIDKKSLKWRKQYCKLLSQIANNKMPLLRYNSKTFHINYFDSANAL